MKKIFFILTSALIFQTGLRAEWGQTQIGVSLGYSMPAGGRWAGQYGNSPAFSLNAEKAKDEERAFGLELGYEAGHEHETITNCAPRVLYLTPYYKETKDLGWATLYATLGVGLYHRWTPAYTDNFNGARYSTSWSGKLGGNFALGAVFDLGADYTLNAGAKLHYIRNFIGTGDTELTNAANIAPMITLQKFFY
ncbi:MAG: hypothetical protein COT17_00315 [Elusimicrobia bacterium CG08_land_8_20_14_0_20_51_18]|nr:MAG: hypothetical protein COT17_00315 [Elusimicrobia bacterium CG08_land_8_20_14_0_20_51_18]